MMFEKLYCRIIRLCRRKFIAIRSNQSNLFVNFINFTEDHALYSRFFSNSANGAHKLLLRGLIQELNFKNIRFVHSLWCAGH